MPDLALCYTGAKKNLCDKLQNEVSSLKLKLSLLQKENFAQAMIIQQLKLLYRSTLQLNAKVCCDAGHYNRKIRHHMYNYVNRAVVKDQDPSSVMTIEKSPTVVKNDVLFFKRLSKNIDLIQSKYGFPSSLSSKIMIAAADVIHVEPKKHVELPRERKNTIRYYRVPLVMYERRKLKTLKPKSAPEKYVDKNSSLELKYQKRSDIKTECESDLDTDESGEASIASESCSCSVKSSDSSSDDNSENSAIFFNSTDGKPSMQTSLAIDPDYVLGKYYAEGYRN